MVLCWVAAYCYICHPEECARQDGRSYVKQKESAVSVLSLFPRERPENTVADAVPNVRGESIGLTPLAQVPKSPKAESTYPLYLATSSQLAVSSSSTTGKMFPLENTLELLNLL